MWINVSDEPVPTYGMNNKQFMLCLRYQKYYGHATKDTDEIVIAIWDSVNECFYEKDTESEICSLDILAWWKSDEE